LLGEGGGDCFDLRDFTEYEENPDSSTPKRAIALTHMFAYVSEAIGNSCLAI
jgi:hypothetical protein